MCTERMQDAARLGGSTQKMMLRAALAHFFGDSQGLDDARADCKDLPSWADLKAQLKLARGVSNGGFNLDMWASVVNRDGVVCAVAFTGVNRGNQWPGSRVISAQKANTAPAKITLLFSINPHISRRHQQHSQRNRYSQSAQDRSRQRRIRLASRS